MKFKALLTLLPLFFAAFTPLDEGLKTKYYYSLKFLKSASPPQKVEMIKADGGSHGGQTISKGILFTYKSRSAKKVFIAGNFTYWKPMSMSRSTNGVWYFYFSKPMDREIKYKFLVDGVWIMDPSNPDRVDDGMGSYISVITPVESSEGRHVTYRIVKQNTVEFRIYKPEARFISLVGDFNHWNPENDLLTKGTDGIWRLTIKLPPGIYRYKYIIDGQWVPDIYNRRSASDDTGQVCSIIEIQ